MDGFPSNLMVCRACLRIVENKTQSFGFIEDATGNLKDMIMCCVPEMDIYVSSNPIMCFPCIQLLVTVYNFKTRCLNTETIIRSYIQRHNLSEYNHVSLSCIVEDLIRLNNYFRDAQHRKIDDGKQNMGSCPPNPNGFPRIPYGVPQSEPGGHIRLPEGQSTAEHPVVPMNHQNVQRFHGQMEGLSPDVARNQFPMQDHFISRHPDMEERERIIHGLPMNSVPIQRETTLPPFHNLINGGVVANDETERDQGVSNKERIEVSNMENDQECNDNSFEHSDVENNSGIPENPTEPASDGCGEENEDEKHNESTEAQSKEDREGTSETDTSRDGIYSSTSLNIETEEDPVTEKRPRLIIRICKNKITIPSDKTEESNEKENEQMDVEVNRTEMPPPETKPFEIHQLPDDNELYQCSNCTFVTTHLNSYVVHKKICGPEGEKKCPHCPHVTNRQYALKKHINTMHTKSIWYMCDVCPYRSTDSSCLRRHKRNVHPERLGTDLMCHLCSYRCTTEYHLKKHMMKHEDNVPLQCEFCSYSTRDRSNFRKHIFIHNPKSQDCEFCDYKCVSPYQMKLHLKKFHHGVGMEDVDCRSEVSISEVVQDISAAIKEAECPIGHQTE